jgi:hypothetical protein
VALKKRPSLSCRSVKRFSNNGGLTKNWNRFFFVSKSDHSAISVFRSSVSVQTFGQKNERKFISWLRFCDSEFGVGSLEVRTTAG